MREGSPDDFNFIISTWLKGLYYGNPLFNLIDPDIYYKNYEPVIKKIISSANTFCSLACLKEDPTVVLAYSIYSTASPQKLHWVFVKRAWRNIGLARDLFPNSIQEVTHLTTPGKCILTTKLRHVKFNPFLVES